MVNCVETKIKKGTRCEDLVVSYGIKLERVRKNYEKLFDKPRIFLRWIFTGIGVQNADVDDLARSLDGGRLQLSQRIAELQRHVRIAWRVWLNQ